MYVRGRAPYVVASLVRAPPDPRPLAESALAALARGRVGGGAKVWERTRLRSRVPHRVTIQPRPHRRCAFIGTTDLLAARYSMLSLVVAIAAVVFMAYVAYVVFWSGTQESGQFLRGFPRSADKMYHVPTRPGYMLLCKYMWARVHLYMSS